MVLNNRDLNQVTWEQRAMEGDPKFVASQILPEFPYADYAKLLGLRGIRVERPEDIGPAWDQALAADVPTVLGDDHRPRRAAAAAAYLGQGNQGLPVGAVHGDPDSSASCSPPSSRLGKGCSRRASKRNDQQPEMTVWLRHRTPLSSPA